MKNNSRYKKDCVGTGFKPVPTGEPVDVGAGFKPAPTGGSTAQVSMEYAIIFAVALAAIFATGIIDKTRNSFKVYFTKASDTMTVMRKGTAAGTAGREGAGGGELPVLPEANNSQAQDAAAAAVTKMASNLKEKLASLKDTYAGKKEQHDRLRAVPIIGILLPEYEKTREGQRQRTQIDAYEKAVEAASSSLKEE